MKKIKIVFLLLISVFLVGCGAVEQPADEKNSDVKKLHIYTTVYPLQYFTKEIGKEYVEVETIYPPGADEHIFEPSQRDMMNLADSDLFIYVGLGLEGFVNKAEQTLKNEDVKLLAAGEHIKGIHDVEHGHTHEEDNAHDHGDHEHEGDAHEHEDHEHDGEAHDHGDHQHGDIDPHVWIDPIFASDLAEAIKNELISMMPQHEAEFQENYRELVSKLQQLDQQFVTLMEKASSTKIIVSHAAYGYWEKRYGIEQLSISGISSSSEPTQKQLKKIISEAKEHNLKYIFFEQNVSSRLSETVQTEMNAEPLMLHNLAVLTDEDMKKSRDYISIMEDNLKALETALTE